MNRMSSYAFMGGIKPPKGKYLEIFNTVLAPHDDKIAVDLCCGLGFGKTLTALQIAALTLNIDGNQKGLFLEPDWARIRDIFIPTWTEIVPPELYTHQKGNYRMVWHNGSYINYRARNINGARVMAQDLFRGIEFNFVIDDETAVGFDFEQYKNIYARIRGRSVNKHKYYFTLSTPKVGAYGRFIKRDGNILIRGRTADNWMVHENDPNYESDLRKLMSAEQARRELDGELVALEGRIWKTANLVMDPNDPEYRNSAWPNGNRDDEWTCYNPRAPYWLMCDLGGATASYVVVQQRPATFRGSKLYDGNVWVAVADLCPTDDASASRAFQRIKAEFGRPIGISAGADIGTRAQTDGRTVAYFAEQVFGSATRINPVNESMYSKQLQFDVLSYLMCSSGGERRFTVARDFVSLDKDSHRGVIEMIDEDQQPPIDKRRVGEILPKSRDNIVQHTRDALLMGAAAFMRPPQWRFNRDPAA